MSGVKRRLEQKAIGVVLESSGAKAILESYDPNYGARPVERYLEGTVVTELSRMLISGELQSGATVHIEGVVAGESDEESSLDDCNYPVAKKARTLNYRVVENANEQNMEDEE